MTYNSGNSDSWWTFVQPAEAQHQQPQTPHAQQQQARAQQPSQQPQTPHAQQDASTQTDLQSGRQMELELQLHRSSMHQRWHETSTGSLQQQSAASTGSLQQQSATSSSQQQQQQSAASSGQQQQQQSAASSSWQQQQQSAASSSWQWQQQSAASSSQQQQSAAQEWAVSEHNPFDFLNNDAQESFVVPCHYKQSCCPNKDVAEQLTLWNVRMNGRQAMPKYRMVCWRCREWLIERNLI